jgi:predicted GNAT family N-acyltransferase
MTGVLVASTIVHEPLLRSRMKHSISNRPWTIERVDFAARIDALRAVRVTVFVAEQGVPESIELDSHDEHCLHVLASVAGDPVGTGRIDLEEHCLPAGKIGRVAVLRSMRGKGVGAALMSALHEIAMERGLATVWCNAQIAAVPFYARLGYDTTGGAFVEAGIEHIRMQKTLP